jgi:two-component system KDP operon response regulator KdpE
MTPQEPLVLVIDDEFPLRQFLHATLTSHGYRVSEAATLGEGLRRCAQESPDVVLLDLGLPDGDGTELTQRIRQWSSVPIVVLSAREQEADKIRSLDAGADDYLTKPFGVGELLARIRAALRHRVPRPAEDPVLTLEDVRIDIANRQIFRSAAEVHLTPIEWNLLSLLVQNLGRVVTHRQLLTSVWGTQQAGEVHYLRVYMAQLRHKLEQDPARPRLFLTEAGIGYRLKAPPGP